MVARKRPSFGPTPKPSALPPAADEWAAAGGTDPELQADRLPPDPDPTPQSLPEETPEEAPEEQGKAPRKFPHRISFDMDKTQYKRLKWASFDSDRPMNEVLREAVEDWLKAKGY